MGVSTTPAGAAPPAPVAWHDLECGAYRADLPLWRELAQNVAGPVLDVGAGTGRVALDLARAGHAVLAVDVDPVLLEALRRRAHGLPVTCLEGDARRLALDHRDLSLCVVPMQTIQLLGGERGRAQFLRAAREHLRTGGLLACALAERLEAFDADRGPGPAPDRARYGDTVFESRPTAVREHEDRAVLERERRTISDDGRRDRELNVIELDRLSRRQLEREAVAAGFKALRARRIAATRDHVGSTVVMLRA
jgi:SAM-dependent methyltransferase